MQSTHLDRRAVEKLFRVPQRRARQIMAGLGFGKADAVSVRAPSVRVEESAEAFMTSIEAMY